MTDDSRRRRRRRRRKKEKKAAVGVEENSPATSSAVPKRFKGIKGSSFSVSRSLVMSDSMKPVDTLKK